MLSIRQIHEEAELKKVLEKQGVEASQMESLLSHSRCMPIGLSLLDGEKFAGIAFGLKPEYENNRFILHHFTMAPDYRTVSSIVDALEHVIQWLWEKYEITDSMFTTCQCEKSIPPVVKILKGMPGIHVKVAEPVKLIGINTEKFNQLRVRRWYRPAELEKKGYRAVAWDALPPQIITKFRGKEEQRKGEKDYLSPGLWDDDWVYDRQHSTALMRKDSEGILGWMITEQTASKKAIRVRRFYLEKEARPTLIAKYFAAWMLKKLSNSYQQIQYEVEADNSQMNRITHHQFDDCLDYEMFRHTIFIHRKENVRNQTNT